MSIIEKLGITPRPWYRTFWDTKGGIWKDDERSDIQHGDSENICDCIYSEADGKLFFAAPEMLEALIDLARRKEFEAYNAYMDNGWGDESEKKATEEVKKYTDIIKKATGLKWEKVKEK
jgi:hypothetical protein